MFQALDESVDKQLNAISQVAMQGDDRAAVALTRSEVPYLVATVRALLDAHQPDANGCCPSCHERRWWRFWRRRQDVPCRAYLQAQRLLVMNEKSKKPRRASGRTPRTGSAGA